MKRQFSHFHTCSVWPVGMQAHMLQLHVALHMAIGYVLAVLAIGYMWLFMWLCIWLSASAVTAHPAVSHPHSAGRAPVKLLPCRKMAVAAESADHAAAARAGTSLRA